MGQIEIMALRRRVEAEQGEGFDIKAFHDTMLTQGAMTLPMLRDHVSRVMLDGRSGPVDQ
jgi:uncharacterized protein (DUF885 family)